MGLLRFRGLIPGEHHHLPVELLFAKWVFHRERPRNIPQRAGPGAIGREALVVEAGLGVPDGGVGDPGPGGEVTHAPAIARPLFFEELAQRPTHR
jgi:hypothetical protein